MSIWVADRRSVDATFYLAEIGDEHAGKRMRITAVRPRRGFG